jgi:hypothetical protein
MQHDSSSPKVAAQASTLADLTAATRRTTGERPPPLVSLSGSTALALRAALADGQSLYTSGWMLSHPHQ